jgi:two-component system nitrogen regulation response regulator GlnG
LFGHEKGAFTGAQALRQGRFEQANGGTLFLDEIGDMPAELQTRLLRVLADGTFYRVGGRDPVKVDVRIVAATHQNLEDLVAQGKFREDLFHRLNVIRIQIPSLRERREDIPALIQHFLKKAAAETGEEPKFIRLEVIDCLTGLDWPGNVRQLENTCRWLAVMAAGKEIRLSDLPPDLQKASPGEPVQTLSQEWQSRLAAWATLELEQGADHLLVDTVAQVEEILIRAALAHTGGYKKEAAKLLGWGRNTLTRKIKELGLAEFESA